MARHILGLAALLVLGVGALPARACINDREIGRAEREFKSQYLQQAPAYDPNVETALAQGPVASIIFFGAGAVLLLGSTLSALTLPNRPRAE
jgi:hypothetical protein